MLKPYKIERADNTIKITTANIVELDFFYYNKSIYKGIIEVVYTLKMSVNFISIEKL